VQAPPTGWGVEHALNAWGSYWRDSYFTRSKAFHNIKECQYIDNSNLTVCGTRSEKFVNYDPPSDACSDSCLVTVLGLTTRVWLTGVTLASIIPTDHGDGLCK